MSYPTWSDLSNDSIVPPMGTRQATDIGPVAVMVSCEPDMRFIGSQFAASNDQPFFTAALVTGKSGDKGICITGPFIGSPLAAMMMDSLIAKGAEQIVFLGWCGAVSEQIQVGDILVPDKAIVDEGTSANYRQLDADLPVSSPDPALTQDLAAFMDTSGIKVKKECIWTTDGPYRETPKKVACFKDLGAKAVEMECSALFSVGHFRKIPVAALLVVSDSVASKDWDPGFRNSWFKTARKKACSAVLAFARTLERST